MDVSSVNPVSTTEDVNTYEKIDQEKEQIKRKNENEPQSEPVSNENNNETNDTDYKVDILA